MRPICLTPLLAAALLLLTATPPATAQGGFRDPGYIPRFNVAVGYNLVHANAPPGQCNCFTMNGGYLSTALALRNWFSVAGEITGGHANNIGPLGQGLTLTTYTAGPRITMRTQRFTPFAQAMFGVGHGADSYFPHPNSYSTSATSFAYTLGGGLDYKLTPRFDIRPVELQYLHTAFPNGTNDSQNHLVYGAAVVFKIGSRVYNH